MGKTNTSTTNKTSSSSTNKTNTNTTNKTSSSSTNKTNTSTTNKTSSSSTNKTNTSTTNKTSSRTTNKTNISTTNKTTSTTNKTNTNTINKTSTSNNQKKYNNTNYNVSTANNYSNNKTFKTTNNKSTTNNTEYSNYNKNTNSTSKNNSGITSIKTGSVTTNGNSSYKSYTQKVHATQQNNVETVDLTTKKKDPQKIDVSNIDLDRITTSSDRVLKEDFVKVNKDLWNKANLSYTDKGNGTYLIKNGDVPYGFTDSKGIKAIKTGNSSSTGNSNNTGNSNKIYQTNPNSSTKSVSEALKHANISYKNGLYYDKENKKLSYGNEDLTYLMDNGLVTFSKLPSAEVKKVKNGYELDFFNNSSIVLKDEFVIDKNSKGKTESLYQNTNGNLTAVDGTYLYNKVDNNISNNITSIKKGDIKKMYSDMVKENPTLSSITEYELLNSQGLDKFKRYYYYIDNMFDDSMTFSDKKKYSVLLEKTDKENNKKILYSTPITKTGKIDASNTDLFNDCNYNGEYLSYYNEYAADVKVPLTTYSTDSKGKTINKEMSNEEKQEVTNLTSKYYSEIMENGDNNYSAKFKNAVYNSLDDLILINTDENFKKDGWAAYTTTKPEDRNKTEIIVDLNNVRNDENYMIDSYTHELGHVYAASTDNGLERIDTSKEWSDVYNQVNRSDNTNTLLRDYAHSDKYEMFAEAVSEYYASGKNDFYNPNDLKVTEINTAGYDNLYDYMTSILT